MWPANTARTRLVGLAARTWEYIRLKQVLPKQHCFVLPTSESPFLLLGAIWVQPPSALRACFAIPQIHKKRFSVDC